MYRALLAALICALSAPVASAKLAFKRTDTPLGFAALDVAIADLDRKKGPDIVVADETNGAVKILLNKGNGRFKAPASEPACALAREVVIGKLDLGSSPDLLVDCGGGNYGAVTLLGNGSGGFATAKDSGLGVVGVQGSLDLGRINTPGGGLDVAYAGFGVGGQILCTGTGDGDGTFSQGAYCAQDPDTLFYQRVDGPIDVADISGDAKAEVMTFEYAGTRAAFFGWDLMGFPFSGISPYPTFRQIGAVNPRGMQVVDLDRDGDRDVVTAHYDGRIGVFRWGKNGIPASANAKLYKAGTSLDDMALGDFNGDRRFDAASSSAQPVKGGDPFSGAMQINLGKRNATFATPAKRFGNGVYGGLDHLAVGDLNRDGRDDIATVAYNGQNLSILLSK